MSVIQGNNQSNYLSDYNAPGGNLLLEGLEGDDVLESVYGNNTLDGGAGNDEFYNWVGNDVILGGAGNDSIYSYGAEGTDTLEGGAGEDVIYTYGADLADGGDGNDVIYGGDGNATLLGGAGDDIISARYQTGDKVIDGGDGNDTLIGGYDIDRFVITAEAGASDLVQQFDAARDVLDLNAFTGETVYVYANEFQHLVLDLGNGQTVTIEDLRLEDFFAYRPFEGVDPVLRLEGGTSVDYIHNWFEGEDALLLGHGGNDQLSGNTGNDTLDGGEGHDTIVAGDGNDLVLGGAGDDYLAADSWGNAGNDTLDGGAGDDVLFALGAEQGAVLIGGEGHDEITDSYFNDVIDGGAGNDTIYSYGGDDVINAGDGDDVIASLGNDIINAGAGNDRIYAGDGNSVIDAGDGDDFITARYETGDKTFIGGLGNDTIEAGDDADSFIFSSDAGSVDTITYFDIAEDIIDLSAVDGVSGFDDLTIFQNLLGHAEIVLGNGQSIVLSDIQAEYITAEHFIF